MEGSVTLNTWTDSPKACRGPVSALRMMSEEGDEEGQVLVLLLRVQAGSVNSCCSTTQQTLKHRTLG